MYMHIDTYMQTELYCTEYSLLKADYLEHKLLQQSARYLYSISRPIWPNWQTSLAKWQANNSIFLGWTFHAKRMNNME